MNTPEQQAADFRAKMFAGVPPDVMELGRFEKLAEGIEAGVFSFDGGLMIDQRIHPDKPHLLQPTDAIEMMKDLIRVRNMLRSRPPRDS